jgi:hypothetical protein
MRKERKSDVRSTSHEKEKGCVLDMSEVLFGEIFFRCESSLRPLEGLTQIELIRFFPFRNFANPIDQVGDKDFIKMKSQYAMFMDFVGCNQVTQLSIIFLGTHTDTITGN